MGLPELKIAFNERIRRGIPGVDFGVLLLVLKDSSTNGVKTYESFEEVDDNYSEKNKKYIENAFVGNVQEVRIEGGLEKFKYKPSKVIVYSIGSSNTIDKAMVDLENTKFDYVVMPEAEEEDTAKIIGLVKKIKASNIEASALVSTTTSPNNEDVIKLSVEDFESNGVQYTVKDLLPLIGGILAGTPLGQSITYAAVEGIQSVPSKGKSDVESVIDGGALALINKGGKVRIARGVTSLTGNDRGESFKKIKLVRIYKYINNVITDVISNYYVGKVPNNYESKLVLVTEIRNFLTELKSKELVDEGFTVDIDVEKQKEYLKSKGVNLEGLGDDQIKALNTGSKVFIFIKLKAVDAMEDFNIRVEV